MKRSALAVGALALVGCVRPPEGMMGHRWGEADVAADCRPWEPWRPETPFEQCTLPSAAVLDRPAALTVVRSRAGLDGYVADFGRCTTAQRDALRRDARRAFARRAEAGELYARWDGGEILRLVEFDGACTLVVAGPRFGRAYLQQQLAAGFGGLLRVR